MSTVFPSPALESPPSARRTRLRAVAMMMCAAIVAASLPARPALAEDSPPAAAAPPVEPSGVPYDELTLKNGGMLRGTIVSIDPDKEVVILIDGTREQRHVPAADVAHIARGTGAPFPIPIVPMPPPPPPPSAPTLGAPRIHIVSDRPITLHGGTSAMPMMLGRYRPVACVAPCDEIVDGRGGERFYFAGDEIPRSDEFQLAEKSGDVRVTVTAGNDTMGTLGSTGIALGTLGAVVGGILLTTGAVINAGNSMNASATPSLPHPPDTTGQTFVTAAEATLVASGVSLVTGIVLNALSHTRYDFETMPSGGVVRF